MKIAIQLFGHAKVDDNRIILVKENGQQIPVKKVKGIKIDINGHNNLVIIEEPYHFQSARIHINSDNNSIYIGANSRCSTLYIDASYGFGMKCTIGKNLIANGLYIILGDKNAVSIGDNCLIATNVKLWGTDRHTILDKNTSQILNGDPVHLKVGDNCWIGEDATLLKNTILPDWTIVGLGTVVTKQFKEPYTIIAGNPAKIIKENIKWNILDTCHMMKEKKK